MNPNPNNVANITDKQPAAQCEFRIQCMLRGFPIEITGSGRAQDLKIIVDRLFDLGAEPPNLSPIGGKSEPTKAAGLPTCPIHNAPMKPSQKPGSFFCPKKNDDGSHCRQKA